MQSSKAKHQVMAYLLDLVIIYAFFLLLFASPIINLIKGIKYSDTSLIMYSTIFLIIYGAFFMLFIIFYFVILPLIMDGQTIGKRFFRIKIVRVDNKKLDATTLFVRDIVGRFFIDLLTFGLNEIINLFVICLTEERRGFHDVLASTRIVDVY